MNKLILHENTSFIHTGDHISQIERILELSSNDPNMLILKYVSKRIDGVDIVENLYNFYRVNRNLDLDINLYRKENFKPFIESLLEVITNEVIDVQYFIRQSYNNEIQLIKIVDQKLAFMSTHTFY